MPEQRPYQAIGSAWLRGAGRAVLADEPGVGKTNQLLLAAEGRTLILSPAMLADVWAEELDLWNPTAKFTWFSYSGVCKRIPEDDGKPASMVVPVQREDLRTDWDTIICDEAHYLKGRNTNWTKVVATKLRSDRIYLATGTPLPNWGHEIFMFLRLLYPGDRRFTNYWNWVHEYFKTWNPPYNRKATKIGGLLRGLSWEQVAQEWGLANRWLRRSLDEVLPDLPPMTRQTIRVLMTPKQAAVYNRLKKEWLAELPDTGDEVVSWNDGGIHQKLLQCSTGLPTIDPRESASCKLDLVKDLMVERTHPTILFCAYVNTAEALGKLMRKMGRSAEVVSSRYSKSQRLAAIKRFRQSEADILVGTVGVLSEGITLTRADTCVFVERSPRPVTNDQARRRIRRFGQERPTLSIDLVTEGTVDDALSKLLEQKSSEIDLALTGFQLAALMES